MTAILDPAADPLAPAQTVADLLNRLGNIPPERVRLRPAPGTATEADVIAIEARENRLFELVDGVLVEKAMGYWESVLAIAIAAALRDWVKPRQLGVVSGADGMVRLFPGRVRIPDVAYASWSRFPEGPARGDAVPQVVLDLAVEVLSDSNTENEMRLKRQEYFETGVRLMWEVDAKSRTVAVYTSPDSFTLLHGQDTLDGGAVLPGFMLKLQDIFDELPA